MVSMEEVFFGGKISNEKTVFSENRDAIFISISFLRRVPEYMIF